MPIIADSSEAQHLPPEITSQAIFTDLELKTGADFVLSVWDAPTDNEALIWQHIRRGLGVQLKRGLDLVASVYDRRLINQLHRMLAYWDDPQLLHHCTVGQRDGVALFNGNKSRGKRKFTYKAYQSTIRAWQRCGGYVVNLDSGYSLLQWMQDEMERMRDDIDERLIRNKQVRLVSLTSQEETLATFPGIGPTRAHDLWLALPQHHARQTLLQALCWMTDGYVVAVKGWGKGLVKKSRKHLGVEEGERLWVEPTRGYERVNDVIEVKGLTEEDLKEEKGL